MRDIMLDRPGVHVLIVHRRGSNELRPVEGYYVPVDGEVPRKLETGRENVIIGTDMARKYTVLVFYEGITRICPNISQAKWVYFMFGLDGGKGKSLFYVYVHVYLVL